MTTPSIFVLCCSPSVLPGVPSVLFHLSIPYLSLRFITFLGVSSIRAMCPNHWSLFSLRTFSFLILLLLLFYASHYYINAQLFIRSC